MILSWYVYKICTLFYASSKGCCGFRGRVVKTYVGKDNQVRSVDVKTNNGLLRRPANKLAVLDVANLLDSRRGECQRANASKPNEMHPDILA